MLWVELPYIESVFLIIRRVLPLGTTIKIQYLPLFYGSISLTALSNRVGPTRIWKTLNGKSVKSNDGKNLGEIKKISENYLQLQKGKLRKQRFCVPKYIADAFDGKTLWLLLSEEAIRGKYQYGKKNPHSGKVCKGV
ncbi:MAG: hypothetical protein DLM72_05770 [Candidatus Nitrosopolaris wilkensis]|nr:MAG: hypothetical protein DLM72_05770 [Candidatus Nitrosopolaris wilkensis]